MKKYISIAILILSLLFSGCVTKLVNYPLPITFVLQFPVSTSVTNFSSQGVLSGQILAGEILNQLEGVSLKDIQDITLEAVAFTARNASDLSPNFTGQLEVAYGDTNFVKLLDMNNVNIGQIQGQPQSVDLLPAAVQLINNAVEDILMSNSLQNIFFRTQGTLNPPPTGTLNFVLEIELTITTVVQQEQDIFDPLGG